MPLYEDAQLETKLTDYIRAGCIDDAMLFMEYHPVTNSSKWLWAYNYLLPNIEEDISARLLLERLVLEQLSSENPIQSTLPQKRVQIRLLQLAVRVKNFSFIQKTIDYGFFNRNPTLLYALENMLFSDDFILKNIILINDMLTSIHPPELQKHFYNFLVKKAYEKEYYPLLEQLWEINGQEPFSMKDAVEEIDFNWVKNIIRAKDSTLISIGRILENIQRTHSYVKEKNRSQKNVYTHLYDDLIVEGYKKENATLLQTLQTHNPDAFLQSKKTLGLDEAGKKTFDHLITLTKENATYRHQIMDRLNIGKIRYQEGLIILAERHERKKNRYPNTTTLLNCYNNENEFERYLSILKQTPPPLTERFICASGHWINGEIQITTSKEVRIFLIDSMGGEGFCARFTQICHAIFPQSKLFISEERRQYSGAGCSVFALDDIAHLTPASFGECHGELNPLFSYLEKQNVDPKELTSTNDKKIPVHLCQLPLSLTRTMQSRGLLTDIIPSRSDEEKYRPMNKKGQLGNQYTEKDMTVNCGLVRISHNPNQIDHKELKKILDNKPGYVLFNQDIYYVGYDFIPQLLAVDAIHNREKIKEIFPSVTDTTPIRPSLLEPIFPLDHNTRIDASIDDLKKIILITRHSHTRLHYKLDNMRQRTSDFLIRHPSQSEVTSLVDGFTLTGFEKRMHLKAEEAAAIEQTFDDMVNEHLQQFDVLMSTLPDDKMKEQVTAFISTITKIQKNVDKPITERYDLIKQEVTKLAHSHTRTALTLKECLMNLLAALSLFGLIYLHKTKNNRGTFWYQSEHRRLKKDIHAKANNFDNALKNSPIPPTDSKKTPRS